MAPRSETAPKTIPPQPAEAFQRAAANDANAAPADEDPRAAALALLQSSKDALQDMSRQIVEAKGVLDKYMQAHNLDPHSKDDIAKAKKLYQDSLKVTVVDDPTVPGATALMEKMYGLYEKTFPIAEEREELGKLVDLLAKNRDPKLQASGAPFREQWVMVQDDKGDVVAATNIITFSAAKDPAVAKDVDGTTHLTYIFVDPRYRSLGLGDFALRQAEQEARKVVAATYDPPRDPNTIDLLQVAEQNAPLQLSMENTLTDTAGAKISQFYRRKYFEELGFRELDFHYTQLPLEAREAGGEPGEGMNLIVRGLPGPSSSRGLPQILSSVSSDSMRFHLYNFFDRSVAAGQYEVERDPDWARQSAELHGTLHVKPRLDFMSLDARAAAFTEDYIKGAKFDAGDFGNKGLGEMMGVNDILPLSSAAPGKTAPRAPSQAA
jgi:GNAT superfamily N-acetyltransferase